MRTRLRHYCNARSSSFQSQFVSGFPSTVKLLPVKHWENFRLFEARSLYSWGNTEISNAVSVFRLAFQCATLEFNYIKDFSRLKRTTLSFWDCLIGVGGWVVGGRVVGRGSWVVSTVMTLFRTAGQYPVVLQARTKCFVLQRIRFYYISLQFNSVVCNYGLFHARAASVFGKKSDAVLRFSDPRFPILISASILGKRARQC